MLGPNGAFLDFFTQLMTVPEILAKVEKAVRSGLGTGPTPPPPASAAAT